jgi:hypothetical protein
MEYKTSDYVSTKDLRTAVQGLDESWPTPYIHSYKLQTISRKKKKLGGGGGGGKKFFVRINNYS